MPSKEVGRHLPVMLVESFGGAQGNQPIKGSVLANQVKQFGGKVFDIGDDERGGLKGGAEDGLGYLQQLGGGLGNGLSAAGMSQAKRLAGFGVEQEKALSLFAGRLIGRRASLHH